MVPYKLRGSVICNNCRSKCPRGKQCTEDVHNKVIFHKTVVNCLGKYCDQPCDLKKEEEDITKQQLVDMVKWMGQELNNLLTKDK